MPPAFTIYFIYVYEYSQNLHFSHKLLSHLNKFCFLCNFLLTSVNYYHNILFIEFNFI